MRFTTSELDGTQRRVSKSEAKDLVASGCYTWSEPGQTLRLTLSRWERRHDATAIITSRFVIAIKLEMRPKMARAPRKGTGYIPDSLPPAEIEGLHFDPPGHESWLLARANSLIPSLRFLRSGLVTA